MIIHAFDDKTPAKINPKRSENPRAVEAVILTFSGMIEQYVVGHYDCEKIGALPTAGGATDVYILHHEGRDYGFFRTWVGAPACVGSIEEVFGLLRTDNVIHFGGAGCLDKEIARGKVMIPTAAYRDEGTSYHYAPAADYIRIKNAKIVAACMKELGILYVLGKTWTTDGFYRETCRNFEDRKADGCISVEMEGAAVQALCDFREREVYMFFTSGDLLDAPVWTDRRKAGQIKHTQHDAGHFEIALALAAYVANL